MTAMAAGAGEGAASGGLPPPRTPPWSDMLPEITGDVLRRLPSAADRAGFRSVCRSWRAAARGYRPPPLPLILCPDFALSSPFTDGATGATAARHHRLRLLGTPLELNAAPYGQCVGSSGDWLVCTRLRWSTPPCPWTGADRDCFLVNLFSSETIYLPSPCAAHSCGTIQSSVPLCHGSGEVLCTIHAPEYAMALCKVVLSAPPDTGPSFLADLGSSCIVAAISQKKGEYKLAFCRPGIQSWCICEGNCIKRYIDIEFYLGKLYVVDTSKGDLFAFEFEALDCIFPVVSRAEHCLIEQLPLIDGSDRQNYNLVQSRGKLLLVVRYFTGGWDQFTGVRVFALDFNSNPWRWIEMKGLDGESILISSSFSKSFPASEYDEIEDDHVYFLDPFCPNFFPKVLHNHSYRSQMYSIRDGKINPFLIGRGPGVSGFPMWFCPSK